MDVRSLRQGVSPGQRMGSHVLFFLSNSPWDPTEHQGPEAPGKEVGIAHE